MTTTIIGVGNLGGTVARHLVNGGEAVVLAAKDESRAQALADDLGPLASAASVGDAIDGSDTVVLGVWLDPLKSVLAEHALQRVDGKVVVDPTNPIGFENGQMIRTLPEGQSSSSVVAGLLPTGAHYVKAFGSLGATQLADTANREPSIVLFYATDDEAAATTAKRLIRTAGFEPMDVGGLADVGRMEGPSGDLQGRVLDLEGARTALATGVTT